MLVVPHRWGGRFEIGTGGRRRSGRRGGDRSYCSSPSASTGTNVPAESTRSDHAEGPPQSGCREVDAGALGYPVITWEQVQTAFGDVAPRYFDAILTAALQRYPELASRKTGHQDADLTGEELVGRYLDGDDSYPWMGRRHGLGGRFVAQDVVADRWRTFTYQCRERGLPENPNWFPVADFVKLLRSRGAL